MVNKSQIWRYRSGIVLAQFLLASTTSLSAQVSFQSVSMDGALISPSTLFVATLFNAGGSSQVELEGELLTRGGELVVSFHTEPAKVASGVTTLTARSMAMRSFVYGQSEAARNVKLFQRLANGEYHYCVRLRAPQAESEDEYCDDLIVDEALFLDLVQPWDGDSIDEIRPPLTWTITGSLPSVKAADIRLVLVGQPNGSNAAQALASERPIFMVPHVKARTVPYPFGVQDLERGKCYAWQVELLDQGRVLDRSEPWAFCVRKQPEPFQNKYVRLDRPQPGSTYEALDEMIFFRYDEPYATKTINCAIYGSGHERIEPKVRDDAKKTTEIGARTVGVNLYELDLQPYALRAGFYELVVRNEKGRDHTLKFHVAP